jgi:structural maintenance of chromosome 3 (chondroitin sulfate proteoglycan 6)
VSNRIFHRSIIPSSHSLLSTTNNNNNNNNLQEVLSFIDERPGELEQEKTELSEYERLDKQRRALEHSLYDRELTKSSDQLSKLEGNREVERERQEQLYLEIRDLQDASANDEDELSGVRAGLERSATKRASKLTEVAESTAKLSALEVEVQEADAALLAATREREQLSSQLQEVVVQVGTAEQELDKVTPDFERQAQAVRAMQAELAQLQKRTEMLYGKQGRGAQFANKADRNKFLQNQIDSIQKVVTQKQAELRALEQEAAAEEKRLHAEQTQLTAAAQQNKQSLSRLEQVRKLIVERTQQRNELQETRKSAWRACEDFQERIQEMRSELEKGKQQLNRTLPKHISQGLATVEAIAAEQGLQGYYGPVIDNISLKSDAFRTAVEVAAGSALFHVIVDTDATAALLMNELEVRKAGRLTFLPLNRLRNAPVTYPQSNDVKPLIEVAFEYDPSVAEAIKQVRTLQCKSRIQCFVQFGTVQRSIAIPDDRPRFILDCRFYESNDLKTQRGDMH